MLVEAGRLVRKGHRVGVLNMASARRAGGGVVEGAGAQEENLHRRSNAALWTMGQKNRAYPIPADGCLVSPGVAVFRGAEKDGYPLLDKPFEARPPGAAVHSRWLV